MSEAKEFASLVNLEELNRKRKRERFAFGESHYRNHFRILCEELIRAGGSVEEFRRITDAYFSAKLVTEEVLIEKAKKDKLNIMANNPIYPDNKVVKSKEESGMHNVVFVDTKEEFVRIYICAQKIHSIMEVGALPMEGQAEWLAELRANHEEEHISAFKNEPDVKVRYSIIFYKDRVTKHINLYPALAISGKFSLGSYRKCFEVNLPSEMDLAMSSK